LNPSRRSDNINIDLDPKYYGKIDLFDERFVDESPSLIGCESLTIKGDIRLESNVTIKGRIVIKNSGKSQAVIKEGMVIDEDVNFK
jgi:UTP--glucose-1-phosphate uridylyltransferase